MDRRYFSTLQLGETDFTVDGQRYRYDAIQSLWIDRDRLRLARLTGHRRRHWIAIDLDDGGTIRLTPRRGFRRTPRIAAARQLADHLASASFAARLQRFDDQLRRFRCVSLGPLQYHLDGRIAEDGKTRLNLLNDPVTLRLRGGALEIRKQLDARNDAAVVAIDLGRDGDCVLALLARRFGIEMSENGPVQRHGLRRAVLLDPVLRLGIALAAADGTPNPAELRQLRTYFRIDDQVMPDAALIVNEAAARPGDPLALARAVAALADGPDDVADIMAGLILTAGADGRYAGAEHSVLMQIADGLGIAAHDLAFMLAGAGLEPPSEQEPAGDDPAVPDPELALLGLTADADFVAVKAAYYRLVRELHPDRLAAQDLAPDQRRRAEDRLKAVNAAYAALRKRFA